MRVINDYNQSGGSSNTGSGGITIDPTGDLTLNGGTFRFDGNVDINGGRFEFNGGTFSTATGATIGVANNGSYVVNNTGLLINSDITANLTSGGQMAANSLVIGGNGSGMVNVNGGSLSMPGSLTLAGDGSLHVGSGSVNAGSMSVSGEIVHTGGTANTGAGGIAINPGGLLRLNGGSFRFDGDVNIDGGRYEAISGTFSTVANALINVSNNGVYASDLGLLINSEITTNLTSGGRIEASVLQVGAASPGVVTVDGGVIDSPTSVTVFDQGTLNLNDGEIIAGSFFDTAGGTFNHTGGTLTVNGGTLAVPAGGYNITGTTGDATVRLIGTGTTDIDGAIAVNDSARLLAEAGHTLTADALGVRAGGQFELHGGASYSGGDVQIFGDGAVAPVAVVDGASTLLESNVNVAAGFSTQNGRLTLRNGGRVAAQNNIFAGPLGRIEGEGTLQPGFRFFNDGTLAPGTGTGTLTIDGRADLNSGGRLEIELAGTSTEDYDSLHVIGNASLGGTLDTRLLDGFALEPDQQFEIVDIGGSRSGTFGGLGEGALVGFGVLYITYNGGDGNDVELFTDSFDADFDFDGDVDGEDFLAWQSGFGITSGATLADGDANRDGVVNGNDFLTWQSEFGSIAGGAGLGGSAVPEPAAAGLCLLSLVGIVCGRRRFA